MSSTEQTIVAGFNSMAARAIVVVSSSLAAILQVVLPFHCQQFIGLVQVDVWSCNKG